MKRAYRRRYTLYWTPSIICLSTYTCLGQVNLSSLTLPVAMSSTSVRTVMKYSSSPASPSSSPPPPKRTLEHLRSHRILLFAVALALARWHTRASHFIKLSARAFEFHDGAHRESHRYRRRSCEVPRCRHRTCRACSPSSHRTYSMHPSPFARSSFDCRLCTPRSRERPSRPTETCLHRSQIPGPISYPCLWTCTVIRYSSLL